MNAAERVAQVRRATDLLRRSEERFRLLVESVQDYAIFMLDVEGNVASWNAGAQRLKGWSAEEIIGRSFATFYPAEVAARGWPQEELERARDLGRFEDEGWRLRKDGSRFWANVVITALRDADGELRGYAKVTRDLTERRRQEEAVRRSEEQLRLLVEGVRDYAIFMLDPLGHVLTWSAGAAAIKGFAPLEALGRHFSFLYAGEDRAAGRPARDLEVALRDGRCESEGWRMRKDGSVFWAGVSLAPLYGTDGTLRGYASITQDLTEKRRLIELEHSTQRMSEFLAMLAHELRNPLAPIRNAVSILKMQEALPPLLERTGDVIDRQLAHLTRLVDDLLDVGRIATGKIRIEPARVNFRDIVLASVEAARPLIEERSHCLVLELPPQPVEMVGDATRLVQALQNLLNNAARYTPVGGRIALAVTVDATSCVTTVTDTGRGIPAHALERIFELFQQEEEAARSPTDSGLGIGLSLARTLVELHGGMLTASSAGEGQGSTFTMRLPLRRELRAEPAKTRALRADGALSSRVLVVDDNRDSADTMVAVLQLLGHSARAAYDGDEALALASAFRPEVVLLDLNMPGADGFSVMERLRALPGFGSLFVAAMTGYGQQADRDSTLAAGFQAHLTKPVDAEQLQALIEQALPRPQ